jgi:hypothetical protein
MCNAGHGELTAREIEEGATFLRTLHRWPSGFELAFGPGRKFGPGEGRHLLSCSGSSCVRSRRDPTALSPLDGDGSSRNRPVSRRPTSRCRTKPWKASSGRSSTIRSLALQRKSDITTKLSLKHSVGNCSLPHIFLNIRAYFRLVLRRKSLCSVYRRSR